MKITPELKAHMVKHFSLAADADDAAVSAAVANAMVEGKLTAAEVKSLTGGGAADQVRSIVKEEFKALATGLVGEIKSIFTAAGIGAKAAGTDGASATDSTPAAGSAGAPGAAPGATETKATQAASQSTTQAAGVTGDNAAAGGLAAELGLTNAPKSTSTQAVKAFVAAGIAGQSGSSNDPHANTNVASPLKGYDCSHKGATYLDSKNPWVRKAFGGMPVVNGLALEGAFSRPLNHPSQGDKAIAGAWFKFCLAREQQRKHIDGVRIRLTDHDMELVKHALYNLPFTGAIGMKDDGYSADSFVTNRKMHDWEVKALLDDSTSGGLEAVPIAFDDAAILTPLLNGELFPLVNVVNIARGRRMEGFSMSNPTLSWGGAEGTATGLFNTDSFVAAFDTTVFQVDGALEYGNYFEDDAPVNMGALIINRYGEQFRAELDRVVAIGNGTSEPEGIINASLTSVSSDNGGSGPPSHGDYLGLMFGVTKAFRNEADRNRLVYVSNDVSYRRSRNIKVDPASPSTDQRPLYGMDPESYMTLGHPHKIQTGMDNSDICFVNLARYRMYRRLGFTIAIENRGYQATLRNTTLIVVRGRFGGQMELSGAGSMITDAQS